MKRFSILVFLTLCLLDGLTYASGPSSYEPSSPETDTLNEIYEFLKHIKPSDCRDSDSQALIRKFSDLETLNQSTPDRQQDTLLHLVVKKHCTLAVAWLLDQGADWKIRNRQRLNSFDQAVQDGNTDLLNLFLSHLSGAPIEKARAKALVSVTPVEPSSNKVNGETNPDNKKQKVSEVSVKLGFSIANVNNSQITNLNAALKGMYRYDPKTVLSGRGETYFNKVDNEGIAKSIRYLIEGTVTRENLFDKKWNGAINVKAEGYRNIRTVDLSALVKRSWEFFDDSVTLSLSAGPGIRYVSTSSLVNPHQPPETKVDPVAEGRENIKWTPKKDFLIFKAGKYELGEDWTYTQGPSGHSSILEVYGKNKITNHLSFVTTYKHWRTSLLNAQINDNQILFEISFDMEN